MGLRYRKSVKLGPFRINFSKSGVGWSVGNKWARYTKKANGGIRVTRTIPGTGISYVEERRPGGHISEPMPPSVAEAPEKADLPDTQSRPSAGQSKRRIVLAGAIIAAILVIALAVVLIVNRPIDYSDNWRDAPSRRVVTSQNDG